MKDRVLERICPVFVGYYDTSHVLHTHSRETYGKRTVRHYELEYIVSSQDGYIVTDSIPVPVSKGDLLFRYPGMEVEGIGIYHSRFIEFDLNEFAEESDTLKRIPVIFHNWEELTAEEAGFCGFRLAADASDAQILLWRADVLRLVACLLKETEKNGERMEQENRQLQKIRKALAFVQEHYGEEITVEQLAILSGYSTFHFCRLFKSITQLTPMQYIVRYRMQKARERLISTEDKMETIMTQVGFHNYGYFWRTFKKLYGFSPREYRSWILRS